MRVGLMLPPEMDPAEVVDRAAAAEAVGFDFLACGEHVFFHRAAPNAFVALAAAAGATNRIRLLSALTVLPVYPAALAAKMVATLDGVSRGRFELGVGVGGEFPAEFEACGVPLAERGRRTDEALTVLRELFPGGPVDFAGHYTTLRGATLQPPPVQRPRPPVWIGGRREAALRRTARFGDGWLPYLVSPEQLAAGMARLRVLAAEHGRAADQIRGGVYCWSVVNADRDWARRTALDTLGALYQQDLTRQADRYLVAGTPDEAAARLREYADAGAESIVFAPACPSGDLDRVLDTFAADVLPRLQGTGDRSFSCAS
jgi:probable F420-dependent oxidoreductase